jgi:hypothetical protein
MDTRRSARWSTPAQVTLVLSSCLVWSASTGCNEDERKVTSIEVAIRSDFLVGDELSFVYVESLSANEEDVVQRAWLELDADCANGTEGARLLGSIRVDRREDDTAHLRLRGYHRSSGGEAELIAERRVDLRFDGGARATVELLRACAATPGDCDGGLCLPSTCTNASAVVTSSTGAQGLEDCLSRATAEPVVTLPDAGVIEDDSAIVPPEPATVCGDDDGVCPDDCTRFEDADCTLHLGDACSASAECDTGLSCADGVCCESSCEAECFRCDLRGLAGYCRDVVEAQVAPNTPGVFEDSCEGRNLRVQSGGDGVLRSTCFEGFAQCATGEQYPSRLAADGCDVDLSTSNNCGACGNVCPYGVCEAGRCTEDRRGVLANTGAVTLRAGEAIGIMVTLEPGTAIRGLGVLMDPVFASGSVRLALFSDESGSMLPELRLATTAALPANRGRGGVSTLEGPIDAPVEVDPSTTYFVFVVASDNTVALGAEGEDLVCSLPSPDSQYPLHNPVPQACAYAPTLPSIYAVATASF